MNAQPGGLRTTLSTFAFLTVVFAYLTDLLSSPEQATVPIRPSHDAVTGTIFVLSALLLIVNEWILNSDKKISAQTIRILLTGTAIAATVSLVMAGALAAAVGNLEPGFWWQADFILWILPCLGIAVPGLAAVIFVLQFRKLITRLPESDRARPEWGRRLVLSTFTFCASAAGWLMNVWSQSPAPPRLH